jgi:hypothetical protein
MFTLFFAGDAFAPLTTAFGVEVEEGGVPIQQFLQQHFIDAMAQVRDEVERERERERVGCWWR